MAWTTPRTWVTGEIVTAVLLNAQIKDNMDLSAPAKLTTAGDMLYATGANATARLAKGTNGNILHQASCAPAWTATPSITDLTLSGALDVNGTIDYDGTCVDFLSSGDIDIVSSRNAACAIYIAQSTGTSGTIKIHADTGTAVNEGVASIQLLSDVGGIRIKSGLNAAGAIRLTADAGTSETIAIHADQGNTTASICLTSDAGGITLNPGTFVTVGGIADGEIRIMEDSGAGTNYAAIKVQNMSASYTLTLPADDGCCGEALTTNGSGTLTWASAAGIGDVSAHVTDGSTQAVADNTTVIVNFDTETYDTSSIHGTTVCACSATSCTRLTAPSDGKYIVNAGFYFTNTTNSGAYSAFFHKNGSIVHGSTHTSFPDETSNHRYQNITVIMQLDEDEYVELIARGDGMGEAVTLAQQNFSIIKIA